MIVVADTSPIYYVTLIGLADVLRELFHEVLIPPAVHKELIHPGSAIRNWALDLPGWVLVVTPTTIDPTLDLDRGEVEAISLAIEKDAGLLLVDDRKGRIAAQKRGIGIRGTLAVLVQASDVGLIDLFDAFARLDATNFHASPDLKRQILASRTRKNLG